jgi:hypothetical protein
MSAEQAENSHLLPPFHLTAAQLPVVRLFTQGIDIGSIRIEAAEQYCILMPPGMATHHLKRARSNNGLRSSMGLAVTYALERYQIEPEADPTIPAAGPDARERFLELDRRQQDLAVHMAGGGTVESYVQIHSPAVNKLLVESTLERGLRAIVAKHHTDVVLGVMAALALTYDPDIWREPYNPPVRHIPQPRNGRVAQNDV